jgi:geranylgeranyl diphosphate synthase type I
MTEESVFERDVLAFARFRDEVKASVDARLASWLTVRAADARALGGDVGAMHEAIASLANRGGKRLRPVLLAAAYVGCGGAHADDVVMAGVALELLQTYLLIHDDWMDGDDVRRGGPSVHAMLRERFGSARQGDVAGVLAGDHAASLALEALLETPLDAARLADAARELARLQRDVTRGQLLDVRASAETPRAVEQVHALKTASYTTTGPIAMGAALAGASAARREGLARFAAPLGIAFQLRDDLLGTFGDPAATGKAIGGDLREGKRTAIVAEAMADREAKRLIPRVLGVEDADDAEVAALVERIVTSGARARVEARVTELAREAASALAAVELTDDARSVLRGAVDALVTRER